MKQKISKAAILTACIQKQQDLIDNFSQRLEDEKTEAYSHSETPSQTDEGSTSPEELVQLMSQELNFVQYEMSILRSMDPHDAAQQVERGAVVVTDKRTFFIAVSIEEIEVENQKIFGMSEKAPLYAHMKGHKKGDSFEFNKTKYLIEDIY